MELNQSIYQLFEQQSEKSRLHQAKRRLVMQVFLRTQTFCEIIAEDYVWSRLRKGKFQVFKKELQSALFMRCYPLVEDSLMELNMGKNDFSQIIAYAIALYFEQVSDTSWNIEALCDYLNNQYFDESVILVTNIKDTLHEKVEVSLREMQQPEEKHMQEVRESPATSIKELERKPEDAALFSEVDKRTYRLVADIQSLCEELALLGMESTEVFSFLEIPFKDPAALASILHSIPVKDKLWHTLLKRLGSHEV